VRIVHAYALTQGAHDPVGVVIRALHVEGLTEAAEPDGACAGQRAEMLSGHREVGMRLEAEPAGVGDSPPHEVAGQLGRCLEWFVVERREEPIEEPAQLDGIHGPWSHGVLDAKAIRVDEVATHRHIGALTTSLPRDDHSRQARRFGPRARAIGPAVLLVNRQPDTPSRADPTSGHRRLRGRRRLLLCDGAHQWGYLRRADAQCVGDLAWGAASRAQATDVVHQFVVTHACVVAAARPKSVVPERPTPTPVRCRDRRARRADARSRCAGSRWCPHR
jgi:hypothetical protein